MGSDSPNSPASGFAGLFRARADADGTMPFVRFMEIALYDPGCGYYRRARPRVGLGEGTDFFTASSSAPVFGELVAAAAVALLGKRDPRDYAFVELGAEPCGGILKESLHPFREMRTVGIGEALNLRGRCVVFSNELFDAQPFRRFVRRSVGWREIHVAPGGASLWTEVERPIPDAPELPPKAPDGYQLDAPQAAANLAADIAAQPWNGLFLAFDYGKSWEELSTRTPQGTARAYFRHTQSDDLLARPGEQDLTCHVCWDWLRQALADRGFADVAVESQEAFLMRHAAACIEQLIQAEAERFSPRKRSLLQLLHPAHLGQKFQVLHALRDEPQNSP